MFTLTSPHIKKFTQNGSQTLAQKTKSIKFNKETGYNLYNLGIGTFFDTPQKLINKGKIIKLDFIKLRNFHFLKDTFKQIKIQSQTGRKYLAVVFSDKVLYPDYIKSSYNSIMKIPPSKILEMNKIFEVTFYKRRYVNGQYTHEEMLSISTSREMQIITIMLH